MNSKFYNQSNQYIDTKEKSISVLNALNTKSKMFLNQPKSERREKVKMKNLKKFKGSVKQGTDLY